MSQQRRVGNEVRAAPDLRRERAAQQVENQVDRRPAPLDVVLQVGIEPLVAQIELGSGSDQDDGQVEVVEPAGSNERGQSARRRKRVDAGREIAGRQQGLARRLLDQASDLGFADVQAAKRVAARSGFPRTRGRDERLANQVIQPNQRPANVQCGARELPPNEEWTCEVLICMR